MQHLLIKNLDQTTTVTLNRPEVHNAFNENLIAELTEIFFDLNSDSKTKIIVLTGAGKSFSAGADLAYMQAAAQKSKDENIAEALKMRHMFETINTVSKPVIGVINGAALGGGMGLVSVCDIVLAHENAKFALSEVKLGLAPSVISPFVIQKIGTAQARRLFLTAERFDTKLAREIGLVHEIYTDATREAILKKIVNELLANSQSGMAAAKKLVFANLEKSTEELKKFTTTQITELRASAEGQEGIKAFLEKRKASFAQL